MEVDHSLQPSSPSLEDSISTLDLGSPLRQPNSVASLADVRAASSRQNIPASYRRDYPNRPHDHNLPGFQYVEMTHHSNFGGQRSATNCQRYVNCHLEQDLLGFQPAGPLYHLTHTTPGWENMFVALPDNDSPSNSRRRVAQDTHSTGNDSMWQVYDNPQPHASSWEIDSTENGQILVDDDPWESLSSREGTPRRCVTPLSEDGSWVDDGFWQEYNDPQESCQEREDSEDAHASQLTKLIDTTENHQSHLMAVISPSQEQDPPLERPCIKEEDYYAVCPHIGFSSADVQDWAARELENGGSHVIRCQELSCKFTDASLRYRHGVAYGGEIIVMWSAFPEESPTRPWRGNNNAQFLDDCLRKLREIYSYYPEAFCPHIRQSFHQSVNLKTLLEFAGPRPWGMRYLIPCHESVCSASIACSLPDEDIRSLGHGPVSFFSRIRTTPGKSSIGGRC